MIEANRTLFTSFSTKVKPEDGKPGEIEVFLQINGYPATDRQLASLRSILKQAAEKVDALVQKEK